SLSRSSRSLTSPFSSARGHHCLGRLAEISALSMSALPSSGAAWSKPPTASWTDRHLVGTTWARAPPLGPHTTPLPATYGGCPTNTNRLSAHHDERRRPGRCHWRSTAPACAYPARHPGGSSGKQWS